MTHSTPARTTARRVLPIVAAASVAAGTVALTANANAATTTDSVRVTASDDTYASSARPGYTFGSSPSIVAGANGADRMVGYLRFAVGALPAGKAVAKAELKLTHDPADPLPASLKLQQAGTGAWTEATLNQRTAPTSGADVATATPGPKDATVSFDVTRAVPGAGTYAFALTSAQANAVARFRSAESGASGPQLTLTLRDAEAAPAPTATKQPSGGCGVNAKLVPSCNVLWGAAAGGFSDTPRDRALREWEAKSGRTASIYHTYHKGDEMFPTADEIAMTREAGKPRVLLANWKVGYGTTWAKVAAGGSDARIDKLSQYIKSHYTEKFFLAIHHEPENDVNPTAGSGMTAKDYAAMFRHTVQRMRANGVSNAVFVVAYMNVEKWNNSAWWYDLYPGDDVVDWVGVDSYVNAQPKGYHNGDFNNLMNRTTDKAKFPGWYTWATTQHPGKPLMVAEWGVYECATACDPSNKVKLIDTVAKQLAAMPAIKAVVYFDTAHDQAGKDMRIDSTPAALAAFKKLAANPMFVVKLN